MVTADDLFIVLRGRKPHFFDDVMELVVTNKVIMLKHKTAKLVLTVLNIVL